MNKFKSYNSFNSVNYSKIGTNHFHERAFSIMKKLLLYYINNTFVKSSVSSLKLQNNGSSMKLKTFFRVNREVNTWHRTFYLSFCNKIQCQGFGKVLNY